MIIHAYLWRDQQSDVTVRWRSQLHQCLILWDLYWTAYRQMYSHICAETNFVEDIHDMWPIWGSTNLNHTTGIYVYICMSEWIFMQSAMDKFLFKYEILEYRWHLIETDIFTKNTPIYLDIIKSNFLQCNRHWLQPQCTSEVSEILHDNRFV